MTRRSPRLTDPAAFSAGEAIAGGALTLAAYLVTSYAWYLLASLVMGGAEGIGGAWVWAYLVWIYGAMTAVPAVIVGTATAALLGRALRHRASFPVHLVAHAVHAYLIGALATFAFLVVQGGFADLGASAAYPLLWGGPAAAIAALIGWRSIVAIARRRDARRAATA